MDMMIAGRLIIPYKTGDSELKFYTSTGLLICRGYLRIVIGGRGPYVEFNESVIIDESIKIPRDQEWRIDNNRVFYIEFRTIDKSNVKIYFQKKEVYYASYKVGLCYISPFDLFLADGSRVIGY